MTLSLILSLLQKLDELVLSRLVYRFPPPSGLYYFLMQGRTSGRVLDVGCGLNSPKVLPSLLPKYQYTGLDIIPNNPSVVHPNLYVYCNMPEYFADAILGLPRSYDLIISNHNLEH